MGKKDKKKGKGKEKTEKKTAKNVQKQLKKELDEIGEDDIEAIVAAFERQEAAKTASIEEICSAPSPRVNASLVAHPSKEELIMFGGEYNRGDKIFVYNELYRYNIPKNEWKRVSSPNMPPPRSSHQCVALHTQGTDLMFIFSGEFTSPSESQFYHYKDFWVFDLSTNKFEKVSGKMPPPRSGHRMVLWKRKIILFGGFFDNLREVKFYNDLWVFDLDTMKWEEIKFKPDIQIPSPRSGVLFWVHNDTAFMYGGYSRNKDKGQVLTDFWALQVGATFRWEKIRKSGTYPSERSGMAVAYHKKRAIVFGGVFDEVETEDTMDSVFYNDMYNFQNETKRWFPFTLRSVGGPKKPRRKKDGAKKEGDAQSGSESEASSESEEDQVEGSRARRKRNKKKPHMMQQSVAGGTIIEEVEEDWGDEDEEPETPETPAGGEAAGAEGDSASPTTASDSKQPEPVSVAYVPLPSQQQSSKVAPKFVNPRAKEAGGASSAAGEPVPEGPITPSPRIGALMAVQGNTLFIYGGLVEHNSREITLDDMYALDLNQCKTWKIIHEGSHHTQEWRGEASDQEGPEEGEDEEDDDESDREEAEESDQEQEGEGDQESEEEESEEVAAEKKKEGAPPAAPGVPIRRRFGHERKEARENEPLPGETLKDFFARSQSHWEGLAHQATGASGKALRKEAFELAGKKWTEMQPELEEMLRLAKLEEEEERENEEKEKKAKGLKKDRKM